MRGLEVQGKGEAVRVCVCIWVQERNAEGGGSGRESARDTDSQLSGETEGLQGLRDTKRERERERAGLRMVRLVGGEDLPPCSDSSSGPITD